MSGNLDETMIFLAIALVIILTMFLEASVGKGSIADGFSDEDETRRRS